MHKRIGFLSTLLALFATSALPQAAFASPMSEAYSAYHAGNYQTAVSDFQQIAASASGEQKAKALTGEGLVYHKMGQNTQAVSAYQQAMAADPSLQQDSSFQRDLSFAQKDAGRQTAGTLTTNTTTTTAAPSSGDPAAVALAAGDVYIAPQLTGQVDQTKLQEAAQSNDQTPVKIAVLDRLPHGYTSTVTYGKQLHGYLNLGKGGLIVVAAHGRGAGVVGVSDKLSDSQEHALAEKYVAQLGAGNYNTALPAMASDLASEATSAYYRPMDTLIVIFLIVVVVIAAILISASRKKKVQLTSIRGPLEQARDSVISGISYLDNYVDVLPKNNADSDQVRAFRQAAAYKVEQAEKIMERSTEVSDLGRAQQLLQQANQDVQNARKYLDRATGGAGKIPGDDAIQPTPFPVNQQQVAQVPEQQRGVSFFSSQPAPVSSLVPVTLNIDGQNRTVMATPQEAEQIRRGQMPAVRSFNVGGANVPWYAYQNYDPYNDYWTYQNNGWRGIAGGAIAGFVGAELMNSLFNPRPYWGGGWYSPYAYGPGWDTWGGWNDYNYGGWGGGGGGGFDSGYLAGEQSQRAQDYALQDQYSAPMQDPNAGAGASFMGGGGGYDNTDYGNSGGGASFMGGDQS